MINRWEETFMIICKICKVDVPSMRSLSKHIRDKHDKYKSKKYYDNFIQIGQPNCQICHSTTVKFVDINIGYRKTCSPKCAGTLHRKNLANDIEKNEAFIKKVSNNQTTIWKNRVDTHTYENICNKISNTTKYNNSLLSKEELQEKYGWMNRLSAEELEIWKNTIMFNTGAHAWWKNASDEEKRNVYDKRNAARIKIPYEEYTKFIPFSKQSYYILVGLYTAESYFKNKEKIDPHGRRGQGYHLDHKYSIVRGYYDGIQPEIIGSVVNLEILPELVNIKKGANCSITKEILMEKYYAQLP